MSWFAVATPRLTASHLPSRTPADSTVTPGRRAACAVAESSATTMISSGPGYPVADSSSILFLITVASRYAETTTDIDGQASGSSGSSAGWPRLFNATYSGYRAWPYMAVAPSENIIALRPTLRAPITEDTVVCVRGITI